jgi:hypothetical protein
MPPHLRSALPPSLAAKLAALRTEPGDHQLKNVLADLSDLPANQIVRASREIASAASLGWWQPQMSFSLERIFGSSNEQELLRKKSDYAWLFLFHPSGYIREAALDALNSPPTSPFFFSALAWRLNDWVQPVRQAAERCAKRVLHRTAPTSQQRPRYICSIAGSCGGAGVMNQKFSIRYSPAKMSSPP